MASSVTWDTLRQLAGFRAAKGCAISLYVDLHPSDSPTAGDAATRVNSLVDQGAKSNGANRGDQTHEQRVGLREDFERIKHFFKEEFDRTAPTASRCSAPGSTTSGRRCRSASPSPTRSRSGATSTSRRSCRSSAAAKARSWLTSAGSCGLLYRLRAGKLERIADLSEEQPGQHDQGGWSQSRYQRHIDELAKTHLKTVAAVLERHLRRLHFPGVVVVCPEELKSEFADVLAADARNAIVGWTTAESHASPTELYEVSQPVLEKAAPAAGV